MKVAVATMFIALALASVSKADGFICTTPNGDLNVKVFDHVYSYLGTRNAARMIVSNPQLEPGNRTLAVFSSEQGTLWNSTNRGEYLTYTGHVDLRFNNIHKSQLILSEPVAKLYAVRLRVYFNYRKSHMRDGTPVFGALDLVTRRGRHIYSETSCTRYLKTPGGVE